MIELKIKLRYVIQLLYVAHQSLMFLNSYINLKDEHIFINAANMLFISQVRKMQPAKRD